MVIPKLREVPVSPAVGVVLVPVVVVLRGKRGGGVRRLEGPVRYWFSRLTEIKLGATIYYITNGERGNGL